MTSTAGSNKRIGDGGLMRFVYTDGGRHAAGFRGDAGDCVVRAIAIATEIPYRQVYDMVNAKSKEMGLGSVARTGVPQKVTRSVLSSLGWKWHPTMHVGQGCKVHLREDELPAGRLIVRLSKHLTCVIDGVIRDTYDCSRDGNRCVYGYWSLTDQGAVI